MPNFVIVLENEPDQLLKTVNPIAPVGKAMKPGP
jgi:ACT domain-containing protein